MNRRSFTSSIAGTLGAVALGRASALAADELKVAVIPEVATTAASMSEKQPLIDLLQKATGKTIKIFIPTNYAATVEAVGNGGADFAYFGALTYVKAQAKYGVKPLVQREEDRQFHSLFITTDPKLRSLKDLKGRTFAFGDVNSTSGHLIPAKEMYEARVDPDKDLKTIYSGNHTNTAIAVAGGKVDAGALDESVYAKMVADKTIDGAKVRVFHTSKPFVDYVWALSKDVDAATAEAIKKAFLAVNEANDPKLLALLRAKKFVAASDKEYDEIRSVAKKLELL